MSSLNQAIAAVGWSLVALAALAVMVAAVRWAKKGGRGAAILGTTLVLLLGAGLVPQQPQQFIEEAREEKGKKGAESGDPPAAPGKKRGVVVPFRRRHST